MYRELRRGVSMLLSLSSECSITILGTISPKTTLRYPETRGSACYLPRDTFLGMTNSKRGNYQPHSFVPGSPIRSFTTSSVTVQHLARKLATCASPGGSAPSVRVPPNFSSKAVTHAAIPLQRRTRSWPLQISRRACRGEDVEDPRGVPFL